MHSSPHENLPFFAMQFIWPVNSIPTKCDSILIFTSFNNKFCRDIAYFNTKMSYLSDFKRTKSKTLRTAKQTDDELNKAFVWSSANNTNIRLTFLKFDYRKYSNILLLYKSTCLYVWNEHRGRRSSHCHWNLQLHTHQQNDIGGAVLIYIPVQPRSHECTWVSNTFNRENTGQM